MKTEPGTLPAIAWVLDALRSRWHGSGHETPEKVSEFDPYRLVFQWCPLLPFAAYTLKP